MNNQKRITACAIAITAAIGITATIRHFSAQKSLPLASTAQTTCKLGSGSHVFVTATSPENPVPSTVDLANSIAGTTDQTGRTQGITIQMCTLQTTGLTGVLAEDKSAHGLSTDEATNLARMFQINQTGVKAEVIR